MIADVIELNVVTKLDIPPEKILKRAIAEGVTDVVVIGYDKDGELYFTSSKAGGPEVLWLLKLTEKHLLSIGDGD